jgi:hypothetical protein
MLWRKISPPERKHCCVCYLFYSEYLCALIVSPEDGDEKFFPDVVWRSADKLTLIAGENFFNYVHFRN